MTLLFSLILLFQACDWFGGEEDKPQKKSTEFVFTVDTLKTLAQFQVNDLDVIDDTSFVITGYFIENNEDGSIKNEYNQIWWGKKKGYEFKAEKTVSLNDSFDESGQLLFWQGNTEYSVFGGGASVAIKNGKQYSYHFLIKNWGELNNSYYEHAELIRPGEFYLYGRNGSLVYYKDGTFTKIVTGTTLTISHSAPSPNGSFYFYLSPKESNEPIDSTFYNAGILKVNQTTIESIYLWSVLKQIDYPQFIHELLVERDSLFIYGNRGIYAYNDSSLSIIKKQFFSGASFLNLNDGFTHLLGEISYWQDGLNYKQQLPNSIPLRDLYFMDYKNNRVTMINSRYNIITGVRRDE